MYTHTNCTVDQSATRSMVCHIIFPCNIGNSMKQGVVCRLTVTLVSSTRLELCNNCSLSIWLSCKVNSVKIFATFSPGGVVMYKGMKNRYLGPISCFILETVQDMTIDTTEDV